MSDKEAHELNLYHIHLEYVQVTIERLTVAVKGVSNVVIVNQEGEIEDGE